ncbi:MAG: pyridoxal phosphate-dependent aminotransferase [Acidimicrobiales bacterium]
MTTTGPGIRIVPPMSPTLDINERIRALQLQGASVVHLGFGEAGLPVADILREALAVAAADNAYGPVAGSTALRESVAGYFSRRGLATEAHQVMLGPGSKSLLYAILLALDGDVVVPQPSWVSYIPQVSLIGRQSIPVPIPLAAGGIPDPDLLRERLDAAPGDGLTPKAMIITQPDNPTGTLASRALIKEVAAIARDYGLWVIADEIYRDLTFTASDFVGIVEFLPDKTIITSGLSKSLALGGWRIGVLRVPENNDGQKVLHAVTAIASELWSSASAPIAAAAKVAFDEPPEVLDYVARARTLHAKVSRAVYGVFESSGISCRTPQAAFYLYPDLELARGYARSKGITTDVALAKHMLEEFHVAVLPGSAFGDDEGRFRFRVATSLLYGATTEERKRSLDWAASDSTDLPPHIAQAVATIDGMLKALVA